MVTEFCYTRKALKLNIIWLSQTCSNYNLIFYMFTLWIETFSHAWKALNPKVPLFERCESLWKLLSSRQIYRHGFIKRCYLMNKGKCNKTSRIFEPANNHACIKPEFSVKSMIFPFLSHNRIYMTICVLAFSTLIS